MLHEHVLEALQDVSLDSELIKYEQKATFFFTFQVHSIDPYGFFSEVKCIHKGYGTFLTLMERGVVARKGASVPPFCCNKGDHFWSKS